jgi:hypothetical protein
MHDLRVIDPTVLGSAFARAVGACDGDALRALLAPDVRFRAVTPSRSWDFDDAAGAVDTMVGRWFGGDRRVEEVESVVTGMVGDVVRVGYRFRATTPEGQAVVEQQAYLEVGDGKIRGVRLICSGYRPIER